MCQALEPNGTLVALQEAHQRLDSVQWGAPPSVVKQPVSAVSCMGACGHTEVFQALRLALAGLWAP